MLQDKIESHYNSIVVKLGVVCLLGLMVVLGSKSTFGQYDAEGYNMSLKAAEQRGDFKHIREYTSHLGIKLFAAPEFSAGEYKALFGLELTQDSYPKNLSGELTAKLLGSSFSIQEIKDPKGNLNRVELKQKYQEETFKIVKGTNFWGKECFELDWPGNENKNAIFSITEKTIEFGGYNGPAIILIAFDVARYEYSMSWIDTPTGLYVLSVFLFVPDDEDGNSWRCRCERIFLRERPRITFSQKEINIYGAGGENTPRVLEKEFFKQGEDCYDFILKKKGENTGPGDDTIWKFR